MSYSILSPQSPSTQKSMSAPGEDTIPVPRKRRRRRQLTLRGYLAKLRARQEAADRNEAERIAADQLQQLIESKRFVRTNRWKSVNAFTRSVILRDLSHIIDAGIAEWGVRGEDWHEGYLIAVYELYWEWRLRKWSKSGMKLVAKLCSVSLRGDSHPIEVIIDATAPTWAETKRRRLWTSVLLLAIQREIRRKKLRAFLRLRDGIARTPAERLSVVHTK
jgi:hypothetical protein